MKKSEFIKYEPEKKYHIIYRKDKKMGWIVKKIFLNSYASPVYGMFDEEKLASRKIYKHKKRYW